MRTFGILACAALAGCGGSSDATPPKLSFDACGSLALVTTEPTAVQQAGIDAAQELWRARGAPALGRFAGDTVEVKFEDAASAFRGLYDDTNGVIYVNRGLVTEPALSIVIAHEVGHALGLPHVPTSERASVMNPGNITTPPTADDQRAIEALWGVCQ